MCTPSRLILSFLVLSLGVVWGSPAAAEPLKVVASFSILADISRQIGGDRLDVKVLVGPNGDAHVYQPTPTDARTLAKADLVVMNGLGFEGWMERLVKAAGYRGPLVVASRGVTLLKMRQGEGSQEDNADPHAWQDLANGRHYVVNIREALVQADPAGAEVYRARAEAYLAQIEAIDQEARTTLGALPPTRRRLVSSHDAFGYFAHAYGLEFIAPVGVSTDAESSAAAVAALIRQIRRDRIPALFVENISDPRLLERIRRETGARLGGTLFSDALSTADGPAPTYLDMMRHNIRTLVAALNPYSSPDAIAKGVR